jgi:hypothetical protein
MFFECYERSLFQNGGILELRIVFAIAANNRAAARKRAGKIVAKDLLYFTLLPSLSC